MGAAVGLRNLEKAGVALAILVTAALLVLTTPYKALLACRVLPLLVSLVLCGVSLLLRCLVWVLFVLCSPRSSSIPGETSPPVIGSGDAAPSYGMLFAVSTVSLVGMLTPLNLGIDVLRTLLGRRHLRLSVATTGAASVLTREFKLRVSLLLAALMTLCVILLRTDLVKTAVLSVAGLFFVLMGFFSLRSEAAGRFAKRLRIGDVSEAIKTLYGNVGPVTKFFVYSIFVLAVLLEWSSLHLCFVSLDLRTPLPDTFVVFVIQYFLSKTPVLPQGVGAVEAGAFVLLRSMRMPVETAGALLALWNCVRILTPPLLAASFSPKFVRGK